MFSELLGRDESNDEQADDPTDQGDESSDEQESEQTDLRGGDRRAEQRQGDGHGSDDDGTSSDDMPSSLESSGLVLGYPGTDEPVIGGERIVAEPGAVTALVGPNGSGKSTLLKGLARQLTPTEGAVYLDGRDIDELGTKEFARTLGLLSQERSVPDSLTVEELVFHGRYPHRGVFEHVTAGDQQAVDRALDLASCADLRDREVGSLSGGQKQLAWIAMALAQDTDVLLLDEPTTFLDLRHQLEVLDIVDTLRENSAMTVVVVLHDIEQAVRVADRVVVLDDGEVRARGDPETVVTEALLAEVFHVEATVERGENGPRITPLRPCRDEAQKNGSDGTGEPAGPD